MTDLSPESRAGIWQRLSALAGTIADDEVRAQYLATWRARYEGAFPPAPANNDEKPILPDGRLAALSLNDAARLRLVGKGWLNRKMWAKPKTVEALGRLAWGCLLYTSDAADE